MEKRRRLTAIAMALASIAAGCSSEASSESAEPSADSATADSTTASASAPTTTTAANTTSSTTTTAAIPEVTALTIEELLNVGYPLVIGHAGGDQVWPHSTMYAFSESAKAGTDVLEMDVRLTADGVLVVQHDDTVDRTTDSVGRVSDMTYDELAQLDAGYWFADTGEWSNRDLPAQNYPYRGVRTGQVEPPAGYTAADFKVETFRAVAIAFSDLPLDVELKIPNDENGEPDLAFAAEIARSLAAELEDLGRTDTTIVVSFEEATLDVFRDAAPTVATSPSVGAMTAWVLEGGVLHANDVVLQLPPDFDGVSVLEPFVLDKAKAEGYAVWVWPNSQDQENADFYALMIADKGLAGVIAGKPPEAIERFIAEGWRTSGD